MCVCVRVFWLGCSLAVVTVAQAFQFQAPLAPLSPHSVVSPSVSACSLSEKDYGSCALTFTRSLPEACNSLAS